MKYALVLILISASLSSHAQGSGEVNERVCGKPTFKISKITTHGKQASLMAAVESEVKSESKIFIDGKPVSKDPSTLQLLMVQQAINEGKNICISTKGYRINDGTLYSPFKWDLTTTFTLEELL